MSTTAFKDHKRSETTTFPTNNGRSDSNREERSRRPRTQNRGERGSSPQRSQSRPVEITQLSDLISAFEKVASPAHPAVEIKFCNKEESLLARKFLVGMSRDFTQAVSELKAFLKAQGCSEELLLKVEAKFPVGSLKGVTLNKSQSFFAFHKTSDKTSEATSLVEGEPPVATEKGKALLAMVKESVDVPATHRVDVNFILPRDRATVDQIREQVRAFISLSNEGAAINDAVRVVRTTDYNRTSRKYSTHTGIAEFLAEGSSSEELKADVPSLEEVDSSSFILSRDGDLNTSGDVDTNRSTHPIEQESSVPSANELFSTDDVTSLVVPGIHDSPVHFGGTFEIATSVTDSNLIHEIALGEGNTEIPYENYIPDTLSETQDAPSVDVANAVESYFNPASNEAVIGGSLEEQSVSVSSGLVLPSFADFTDEAIVVASPTYDREYEIGSKEGVSNSETSSAHNHTFTGRQIDGRIPYKIERIKSPESYFGKEALKILRRPDLWETQGTGQTLDSDKLLAAFREQMNKERPVASEPRDQTQKSNKLDSIHNRLELLAESLQPLLAARKEGIHPKEIPGREQLLSRINLSIGSLMKVLADDQLLTSREQTEVWKQAENIRAIAGVLAEEPSMAPWQVSPIGPHVGRIVRLFRRKSEAIVELNDGRRVLCRLPKNNEEHDGRRLITKNLKLGTAPKTEKSGLGWRIQEGTEVKVHVTFTQQPVDNLSLPEMKRQRNFKGQTLGDGWRGSRCELLPSKQTRGNSPRGQHVRKN